MPAVPLRVLLGWGDGGQGSEPGGVREGGTAAAEVRAELLRLLPRK